MSGADPAQEEMPAAGSSKYSEQASARIASGPPDPEFDRPDRRRWRAWVVGLAGMLDRFPDPDPERRPNGRVLLRAFRAFLPLADPEWWRDQRPVKLNAWERRRLREVRKLKKRARRGWARRDLGDLEIRNCEAFEIYSRFGCGLGMGRCKNLLDALRDFRTILAARR